MTSSRPYSTSSLHISRTDPVAVSRVNTFPWVLTRLTRFEDLPCELVRQASCHGTPALAHMYTTEEIPGSTKTS